MFLQFQRRVFCEFIMDDENLIEFVRKYPVLYDLSNPKYMDSSFKNEIWIKIEEKIQKDGKYQILTLHLHR